MTMISRFCIFIDGMGRGIIFPIGPALVYHLAFDPSQVNQHDPSTESDFDGSYPNHQQAAAEAHSRAIWPRVSCDFALVVAIYTVGRLMGEFTSRHIQLKNTEMLPLYVARLGGSILSLYLFTYILLAADIWSISWLILIRFLSAALTGFLRQIAGVSPKMLRYGSSLRALHPSSVEAAKTYVAGVLVSVFLSGVLFHYLAGLATGKHGHGYISFVMALAGNSWLAPFFIIGVALSLEALLRLIFSLASADQNHSWPHLQQQQRFSPMNNGANKGADATMTLESAFTPSSPKFDQPARNRIESATSIDDFYDCQSMHSDMDTSSHTVDLMGGSSNNNSVPQQHQQQQQQPAPSASTSTSTSTSTTQHRTEICQYKDKRCVYADGSPSYVPQGDCVANVPISYMEFYRKNSKAAQKAWENSQQWRRDYDVWRIHTLPNMWFPRIKQAYPHFLHGHSKAGYPIVYEQPGRMNLKELFRTGCKIHDMTFHYKFFMEYISNNVCTRDEIRALQGANAPPHSSSSWGIMVVMDVKGAGLSHLSGDVVKYLKEAGDINSAHYPLSMKRAFLVNSPFWLAGAWSGIKGILPESVQVDIRSEKNYFESLCKYIDPDQIPPEYGGSSPYSLGQHPYELGIAEFVKEAGEQHENGTGEASAALHVQQDHVPSVVNAPESTTTKIAAGTSDTFIADPLQSSSPLKSRDRSASHQNQRTPRSAMDQSNNTREEERPHDFIGVLRTVSCLHFISSAVQGSLEVLIPLWMLSPPFVGGLGFSPYRSCLLLLSTFFALLFLIRKIQSESISRIVIHTPLRAFRLGVGAQSLMLALLAFVASPSNNRESWSFMVAIFGIFVCTAFAVIFGHSSCMILHNLALNGIDLRQGYGGSRRSGLEWHGRASLMCLIGEVLGAFIFIPIWSWSMSNEKPTPFDAASSLLAVSLVCICLYMGSFSLLVASSKQTQFSSFAQEAIVVGAADMASLFGEPHDHHKTGSSSITSPGRDLVAEGTAIEKIRKAI